MDRSPARVTVFPVWGSYTLFTQPLLSTPIDGLRLVPLPRWLVGTLTGIPMLKNIACVAGTLSKNPECSPFSLVITGRWWLCVRPSILVRRAARREAAYSTGVAARLVLVTPRLMVANSIDTRPTSAPRSTLLIVPSVEFILFKIVFTLFCWALKALRVASSMLISRPLIRM